MGRIIHAVKIIGWGVMEGKSYWLIENSWGEDWGENGYAKVIAGADPEKKEGIVIETYVLAGTPASKKVEQWEDNDEFESDIDLEDNDIDLDDDSEKHGDAADDDDEV